MAIKKVHIIEGNVSVVVCGGAISVPTRIHRVPDTIRYSNEKFYTPRVVSIGPLHRGDTKLQKFEHQKAGCLKDLIRRCIPAFTSQVKTLADTLLKKTSDDCLKSVTNSIEKIRACYAGFETAPYSDHVLANMMVIDACFVLNFFFAGTKLMGNPLIDGYICSDLLLIENQIPFFVLQGVFQCIKPNDSFVDLIKTFLPIYYIFEGKPNINGLDTNTTPHHILDLVHKLYRPACELPKMDLSDLSFHTATELYGSGVSFQPNHDPNWAMAIKAKLPRFLWAVLKATLKMPVLKVYDDTELILRNLIMHEEFSSVPSYVIGYVFAMNKLIDTPEDVKTLKKSKVLINHWGLDKTVATMMSNLVKENTLSSFFYKAEFENLDAYYNAHWPNKFEELMRKFFTSPWSAIIQAIGIVMFAFALLQAIHNIKS